MAVTFQFPAVLLPKDARISGSIDGVVTSYDMRGEPNDDGTVEKFYNKSVSEVLEQVGALGRPCNVIVEYVEWP